MSRRQDSLAGCAAFDGFIIQAADAGNTVVVIEHDTDVIRMAD